MRAKWIWAGAAGLFAVGSAALLLTLSSDWLREKIRLAIVESSEKATGGRVEVSGFRFDWRRLTAEVDRFAVHGLEPAGAAPLVETGRVRVELEILSLLELRVRRVLLAH